MPRGKDVIDSRDLIDRRNELEEERQVLVDAMDSAKELLSFASLNDPKDEDAIEDLREDVTRAEADVKEWEEGEDCTELKALVALEDEIGSSEWTDGLALISTGYWESYVEELVKDIGDMPEKIPSYIVIDWEATANNVAQDYGTVEWNGDTWYYRSS